tara:strand:+ start:423 stop:623 length:201 start_codon:yes stop_codon:yes gene_type:complete
MRTGYKAAQPGELIFYRPLLEIIREARWPAVVISCQSCGIEPYKILLGGKVISAMHQEVWEVEDGI